MLIPLKLEINCDPQMYISRYVNELNFGDKNEQIIKYANKIVNSMKRNGTTQGRRIAGICGAAIFIAGKLCGYKMTTKEIVKVCQLSEITIQERLKEFLQSKASKMTLDEFKDENYKKNPKWKHSNLPPSFVKNIQLKKEKKEEIINENENKNNNNDKNDNQSSFHEFDPYQFDENEMGDIADEFNDAIGSPNINEYDNDSDISDNNNNGIKKINDDHYSDYDDYSDDSEVNGMILNENEIKVKEKLFNYHVPIDEYEAIIKKQENNRIAKLEKQEKRKKEELLDEKFLFKQVSDRMRKHFGESNKIDYDKLKEIYNENKDINQTNKKDDNNDDNDNDNDNDSESDNDEDDGFDPFKDFEPPKKKRKL